MAQLSSVTQHDSTFQLHHIIIMKQQPPALPSRVSVRPTTALPECDIYIGCVGGFPQSELSILVFSISILCETTKFT